MSRRSRARKRCPTCRGEVDAIVVADQSTLCPGHEAFVWRIRRLEGDVFDGGWVAFRDGGMYTRAELAAKMAERGA